MSKGEDQAGSATAIARGEIIEQICERIIAGDTVAGIFRSKQRPPISYATFYRWLAADGELAKLVASAEERACQALADRVVDVTREVRVGEIVSEGERDGKPFREVKRVDMVDRCKLEAHGLMWTLARRMPKKYGERTVIAGDADNPLVVTDARDALKRALSPLAAAGDAGCGDRSADE